MGSGHGEATESVYSKQVVGGSQKGLGTLNAGYDWTGRLQLGRGVDLH